jgi:hypothetical protein
MLFLRSRSTPGISLLPEVVGRSALCPSFRALRLYYRHLYNTATSGVLRLVGRVVARDRSRAGHRRGSDCWGVIATMVGTMIRPGETLNFVEASGN